MSDVVDLTHRINARKRWRASIEYRSQGGGVRHEHYFDEFSELHDIVERGPNFTCITGVFVFPNGLMALSNLTIEEAEGL